MCDSESLPVGSGTMPWISTQVSNASGCRCVELAAVRAAAAVHPDDQIHHRPHLAIDRHDGEVLAGAGDAGDGVAPRARHRAAPAWRRSAPQPRSRAGPAPRRPAAAIASAPNASHWRRCRRSSLTSATFGPLVPRSIDRMYTRRLFRPHRRESRCARQLCFMCARSTRRPALESRTGPPRRSKLRPSRQALDALLRYSLHFKHEAVRVGQAAARQPR